MIKQEDLKEILLDIGITRKRLGELSGIQPAYISQIVNFDRPFTNRMRVRLEPVILAFQETIKTLKK